MISERRLDGAGVVTPASGCSVMPQPARSSSAQTLEELRVAILKVKPEFADIVIVTRKMVVFPSWKFALSQRCPLILLLSR